MKKIRVKFPRTYPHKEYYGVIDGGTYMIDPEYKSPTAYLTLEKVNSGRGTYIPKDWCTILLNINFELPEDLF